MKLYDDNDALWYGTGGHVTFLKIVQLVAVWIVTLWSHTLHTHTHIRVCFGFFSIFNCVADKLLWMMSKCILKKWLGGDGVSLNYPSM